MKVEIEITMKWWRNPSANSRESFASCLWAGKKANLSDNSIQSIWDTAANKVLKSKPYFITWYKQQFFPSIHVQKIILCVNINFQWLLLEKSCRNGQNVRLYSFYGSAIYKWFLLLHTHTLNSNLLLSHCTDLDHTWYRYYLLQNRFFNLGMHRQNMHNWLLIAKQLHRP